MSEKGALSQEVIKTKDMTKFEKELDIYIHTRKVKAVQITSFWKEIKKTLKCLTSFMLYGK